MMFSSDYSKFDNFVLAVAVAAPGAVAMAMYIQSQHDLNALASAKTYITSATSDSERSVSGHEVAQGGQPTHPPAQRRSR